MTSAETYPSTKDINQPFVSIIISTYNRKEELIGLLSSLDQQTLAPSQFEIIVVDDGSTDDTLSSVQDLIKSGKENLVVCYQKNQGPGAARNRGMSMARGQVFAFTDTDCRPLPDWLEQLIKPFADKQVGAVGGAEQSSPDDPITLQAMHFCMTSSLTTGGLRGTSGKKLARYYPRTFNMAISREAVAETGGFKPLCHGEDIELSFRIKQEGFTLCFNDRARVYHRRKATVQQFFMQVLRMGEARITLARLHPEMLEPLHVLPAAGVFAFVLLAVLALVFNSFFVILKLAVILGLGFSALIGFAGFKKGKSLKLFFFVPVLFFVQPAAYGIGFYRGLWKWITGHKI